MKKLIAALTLMLAFSINANAQDQKELTASEKGRKDATELTSVLKLNNEVSDRVYQIFITKHKTLALNPSEDDKKVLFKNIRKEIKDMLTHEQLVLLENNSKVFNNLTLK